MPPADPHFDIRGKLLCVGSRVRSTERCPAHPAKGTVAQLLSHGVVVVQLEHGGNYGTRRIRGAAALWEFTVLD